MVESSVGDRPGVETGRAPEPNVPGKYLSITTD
jgi:hypothetical protein